MSCLDSHLLSCSIALLLYSPSANRGDWTPLELFIAGIRVWQSWFAVYVSWGICSITQKKKSVTGCSIPNRFSLEAT